MNKALLSSKKIDWCTPQDFFNKLNEEFNFTLDVAATDKTAKCQNYFTPETNGLSSTWDISDGAVFAILHMEEKLESGLKKHMKSHFLELLSYC